MNGHADGVIDIGLQALTMHCCGVADWGVFYTCLVWWDVCSASERGKGGAQRSAELLGTLLCMLIGQPSSSGALQYSLS
jgi:hypothetical protein